MVPPPPAASGAAVGAVAELEPVRSAVVSTSVSDAWTVTKKKLTGTSRSWRALLLGEDHFGAWLYAPAGTENRDASGELINHLAMEGVQVLPAAGWWVAWWWQDGGVTIDIATPIERTRGAAAYVDLELDLWARGNDHGLVDQDEYEASRRAGLISDEQDHQARAAVDGMQRLLTERSEPFARVGRRWLERAQLAAR